MSANGQRPQPSPARGSARVAAALVIAAAVTAFSASALAVQTARYTSGSNRNNWSNSGRWIWAPPCSGCIPGSSGAPMADIVIDGNCSLDTSVGSGSTIGSMTVSNGTTTVASGVTVTTTGDLILDGGNLTASTGAVTVGGSLTLTRGTYTPGSGALTAGSMSVSGGSFAGSNQSGSVTITGDLAMSSGTFAPPTGTVTIGGQFNRTGGSYTSGGTIVFSSTGTATHTFGGTVFGTVTIGVSSGLVGYWKLDETSGTTLADSSPYGNSGTLSGTLTTTSPASGFAFSDPSALVFDGSTVSASLGTAGMPDTDAVQSISLWVKLVNTSGQQNFIVLTDKVSGAIQLGIKDGQLKVWGWGAVDLVSTTAPSTGAWHHVAYTYDGTTNRLYVDGASKATSTTAHQSGSAAKVYLGTWTPNNDMLNGALDEVRVYNRALSATDVSTLAGKSDLSSSAGGTHTFADLFQTSGDFTIGTGTVTGAGGLTVGGSFVNTGGTFSGSGAVTLQGTTSGLSLVPNGAVFNALTVNGIGGSYAFGGAVTVTNDFTITNGTVTGNDPITVGGNWSNSGTFQGTGAVTLTGSGSNAITSNGGRFSSLTINGGGTYTLQDRFSASGATVTLTDSTLAAGSQTARVGQFSFSGTGAFSPGTGTLVLDGPPARRSPRPASPACASSR